MAPILGRKGQSAITAYRLSGQVDRQASIPLPKGFTNDRLRDKPDQDTYMSSERRMLALPPAYLDVGKNEIELLPCGGFQSGIPHFLPRPEVLGAVPVATANLTSAGLIKYAANACLSGENRVDRKPT